MATISSLAIRCGPSKAFPGRPPGQASWVVIIVVSLVPWHTGSGCRQRNRRRVSAPVTVPVATGSASRDSALTWPKGVGLDVSDEMLAMLRMAALNVSRNSYVPYSRFPVGAAAISESGDLLLGCNVENTSFGTTLCAETSLIGSLVSQGGKGIRLITCVVYDGRVLAPCGRCRQLLLEIGGPECLVDVGAELVTIGALLPFAPVRDYLNGRR